MLTPGPTETAPTALVAGVPPKLARIGAGLILLLGALTAIGPFTIDLYLAAFPQITADMGTSPGAVQLTITATLAGLAIGQLLIGSISDAIGRRKPLLAGLSSTLNLQLFPLRLRNRWLTFGSAVALSPGFKETETSASSPIGSTVLKTPQRPL